METPRLIPAASTHQACGPIRFGMKGAELQHAGTRLRTAGWITAATLRQGLVTNGVKHPALFAERDHTIRLEMRHAVGRPLREITFQTHGHYTAAEYESMVKPAWETLQDVADSKFTRPAKKGKFPPRSSVPPTGKLLVSDIWQVEGVRVEVGILATAIYGEPTITYSAVLKVTDLTALPPST